MEQAFIGLSPQVRFTREARNLRVVVDRLAQALASEPAIIASGSVSTMQPGVGSDMPAISVTLDLLQIKGRGVGRIVREGHGTTRNVQSTAVQTSASFETQTFDSGLTRYKLWPLPIRRNPNAPRGSFGQHDIKVTNLTTGTPYVFSRVPASESEFTLDPETGVLRFGAPQTVGHQLEIEHWTVAWRNDIRAERYQGEMTLDVWGASFATVEDIAGQVIQRLEGPPQLLKTFGFDALSGARLGPAKSDVFDPLGGSSFVRWRQELCYRFHFDAELGGEASSGGVIRRIDVDIDGKLPDPFSITQ